VASRPVLDKPARPRVLPGRAAPPGGVYFVGPPWPAGTISPFLRASSISAARSARVLVDGLPLVTGFMLPPAGTSWPASFIFAVSALRCSRETVDLAVDLALGASPPPAGVSSPASFIFAVSALRCSRETGADACADTDCQASAAVIASADTRMDFEVMVVSFMGAPEKQPGVRALGPRFCGVDR